MESTFGITLHIAGSMETSWDKVEIQQTIKERTVDAPETPEETSLKTEENSVLAVDEKASVKGDNVAKKKSRRRPRYKKRRPVEKVTETSLTADIKPITGLKNSEPSGENPPMIQNPQEESVPFIIEPAKPKEVAVTPEMNESATHIIETEKKDEESVD